MHTPDRWVLFNSYGGIMILAGWGGSYLYGDSWRRSSAIKTLKVNNSGDLLATTESGSQYSLERGGLGYTNTTSCIRNQVDKTAVDNKIPVVWYDTEEAIQHIAYTLSTEREDTQGIASLDDGFDA